MTTARLPLAAVLLATWIVALVWRWPLAAELNLGSDGIGQWTGALAVLAGGLPRPPNPEGGHSLWLFGLPPILLGQSLLGAAKVRVGMAALVAPLGAAAAALLAEPKARLGAAALAGALLAIDPGLLDTLHIAFRGYGAPELVALATLGLGLALRGQRLGPALFLGALVGAAGQHPMAGGVLVAGLVLLGVMRTRLPPGSLAPALAVGGVLFLPRLHWLWSLGQCGAGLVACVQQVASGSSETGISALGFVSRAAHDRFLVDVPGGAWSLGVAAVAAGASLAPGASARARTALGWAALATAGVVVLGVGVASLRPYHLRIVAAPMAVALAVGAARLWPVALGLAVALPVLLPRPRVAPGDAGPAAVDRLSSDLMHAVGDDAPVRVDAVWFGDPVGMEPAPVVLSAVLRGEAPDRFQAQNNAKTVLLVNTHLGRPTPPTPPVVRWDQGYALVFADLAAARSWVAAQQPAPVVEGGAADWVGALHPGDPEQDAVSW